MGEIVNEIRKRRLELMIDIIDELKITALALTQYPTIPGVPEAMTKVVNHLQELNSLL